MSVTIKDIARRAGVSHITVSRALNGHTAVRPETREKIKQIADELQYVPNYHARNLVLDRSCIIGLFFSTLGQGTCSEYFQQAVVAVNSMIKEKYNMVIRGIDEYQQDFQAIHKRNFDGILVMSQREEDDIFIRHVLAQDIPVVIMNRESSEPGVVKVLLNDRQGAYEATRYLLQCGHQNIGLIEGKHDFNSSIIRKQGCQQALQEAGHQLCARLVVQGDYGFESGYEGMKTLLQLSDRPTAVFCFNDNMAIGAIRAVVEAGLNVPDDISIIGFDGSFFSAFSTPALSTVTRPIQKMSARGARRLLELIDTKDRQADVVYIDTMLQIRQSVKQIG